ncbi:DNA-binding IclR family transcriptional regulator [Spinactinospora alkalitolerans]|uniref:DNA-binding IclR family transcriptional regulator n=1 Tax=Spinactinospora alkalitolerans TaxID=687207 RepID=A0A852TVK9_9ACTN|nr:IclR family transcriptional regulator [Spinactinospora alkalitolerans]NYE47337.1 DNA-binding IclR family transcriptional regulator [Spinactinospora alkalitolerans]
MAADSETESGVRSVLRALDLLALFDERHQRRSIRELTDHSGLAKTTVLRLVATLEQRGLLWTRPDGRIAVGPGLLRWAGLARAAWQVPEAVRQVMRELVAETAETVNLYVRSDAARVCVAQQEGPRNLRHVVNVGDELPLWSGAAAKILLIGCDDALLRRVAAASPHGARHAEALRGQVALALRQGHAVSHGERETGASGVAAPVTDAEGRVQAALALGGPTARFTDAAVAEFATAVTRAARRVSDIGLDPAGAPDPDPGERR